MPCPSLGLLAKGGASRASVARFECSKANEALVMSKGIAPNELMQVGFMSKLFDCASGEKNKFLDLFLGEVESRLRDHLIGGSLIRIEGLIWKPERGILDARGVAVVFG